MRKQTIEEYISTLSESEKEQYKYLIEESRQRDREIKKNYDTFSQNLCALWKSLDAAVKASETLAEKVLRLNAHLQRTQLRFAKVIFFSNQYHGELLQHYPKSLN